MRDAPWMIDGARIQQDFDFQFGIPPESFYESMPYRA
jgi:hypothetical protein